MILAQIAEANNWVTPISGAAVVALLSALTKWLMSTITQELKALTSTINEHTRSLEKALDHNTRATLLMGIAAKQSNTELDQKLKDCYAELIKKEELSAAKRDKGT